MGPSALGDQATILRKTPTGTTPSAEPEASPAGGNRHARRRKPPGGSRRIDVIEVIATIEVIA